MSSTNNKLKIFTHIAAFILGAVLLAILLNKCNPCPEVGKTSTKVTTKRSIKIVYDSTYKEAYFTLLDQIPEEKPVYRNKLSKRIQKLIEKENKNEPCGPIRKFVTQFRDSSDLVVLTGKITSLTKGKVLSTDLVFKTRFLDIDTTLIIHDSIFTDRNNYITSNKLYFGIESSVSPAFNQFSGTVDFTTKNNWIFGGRVERNFDYRVTEYHVKLGHVISFRKRKK